LKSAFGSLSTSRGFYAWFLLSFIRSIFGVMDVRQLLAYCTPGKRDGVAQDHTGGYIPQSLEDPKSAFPLSDRKAKVYSRAVTPATASKSSVVIMKPLSRMQHTFDRFQMRILAAHSNGLKWMCGVRIYTRAQLPDNHRQFEGSKQADVPRLRHHSAQKRRRGPL
jgi:hypothetical protein